MTSQPGLYSTHHFVGRLKSPAIWAPLIFPLTLFLLTVSFFSWQSAAALEGEELDSFPKWGKVELEFAGPAISGPDDPLNPFAIHVKVSFNGPGGQVFVIPAFFDGDGAGGLAGDIWKVRFSPDEVGVWTYTSASEEPLLDGHSGTFTVTEPVGCQNENPNGLPELYCVGRLEYTGRHYLKFADGGYWIKGGIDDPENFLGSAFGDWAAKRAAIDYLSSKGVNSVYLITNNIDGDDRDVWPWLGATQEEAKSNSDWFDVARLQAWEDFFSYVQSRGIVLHLVLEDDGAWHAFDRAAYYREMVARFGHHPGLIWNIGEEADENYSDAEQIDFAVLLGNSDPYGHPITVHRKPSWPFLGNENFDLTSMQVGNGAANFSSVKLLVYSAVVNAHREASAAAGRPIPIMIDETPQITEVNPAVRDKMRTQVLYPIFLSGGNYELHYFTGDSRNPPLPLADLGVLLDDMLRARLFSASLPFYQMNSCNQLLSTDRGWSCFGQIDQVYVVYFASGGQISLDLSAATGEFDVSWFDPRSGVATPAGNAAGGGWFSFQAPDNQDWVLLLEKPAPEPTPTFTPEPTVTPTPTDTPTAILPDTATPLPTVTKTSLPTDTAMPLSTDTPTPLPTDTAIPWPTDTPTQTDTIMPQPTDTATPSDTPSPLPTDTATPMPTETGTPLPTDTTTPLPTDTPMPLPTDTPTPTFTPTAFPTNTPTPLPTNTPTPPPTNTPTSTFTATPLPTDTPTTTDTPTPLATGTPIPTDTPTPLPTGTPLPTDTPTYTATPLPTETATPYSPALLVDDFARADGDQLGNGWTEVETPGGQVGLSGERMCFLDSSDLNDRPQAQHSFQQVSNDLLLWQFAFDWQRTGNENNYQLFMQLGDGALMSADSQDAGVGVNLVWTSFGRIQELLGYQAGGTRFSLVPVSGSAMVSVLADVSAKTFQVSVNGALVGANLPFDHGVSLDSVRYFTDGLNEIYFSGGCFDDVLIEAQ